MKVHELIEELEKIVTMNAPILEDAKVRKLAEVVRTMVHIHPKDATDLLKTRKVGAVSLTTKGDEVVAFSDSVSEIYYADGKWGIV